MFSKQMIHKPILSSKVSTYVQCFECRLNILAELLRFGDREFYKDWWNAKTVEEVAHFSPLDSVLCYVFSSSDAGETRLTVFVSCMAYLVPWLSSVLENVEYGMFKIVLLAFECLCQ